ncbi:hypothetical protein V498_06352, partial [Pseudogymnoascus sp. VKM F-4517 (FW-2822)]
MWGRPALEVKRERGEGKEAKQPIRSEVIEGDLEEAEQPVQPEEIETIDNDVYKSAGVWKKEWTSARVQGIIQRECKKGMNVKMNINAWRNMVEAISQKFLQHPFEFDSDEEWKDEADEIWEEQFGHTAPM